MKFWKNSVLLLRNVIIATTIGITSLIIFFPGILTKYLQIYANTKYLSDAGLHMRYEGFTGDLFGTIHFNEVTIEGQGDIKVITLENTGLNIDFLRLLRRDLSFDEITVDSLVINLPDLPATFGSADGGLGELPWISVKDLKIGSGRINWGGESLTVQVQGDLDITDVMSLADAEIIFIETQFADTIQLLADDLNFDGTRLDVHGGFARLDQQEYYLDGAIRLGDEPSLDLGIVCDDITPFLTLPEWVTVDKVDGRIVGPLDQLSLNFQLGMTVYEKRFDTALIRLESIGEVYSITYSKFIIDDQEINVAGNLAPGNYADLKADFKSALLSDFLPELPDIELTGSSDFFINWHAGTVDSLDFELELQEVAYEGLAINDLTGSIAFVDHLWSVRDTLSMWFAESNIDIIGNALDDGSALDLELYVQTDTLGRMFSALGMAELNGEGQGQLWVSGSVASPNLTGAVNLEHLRMDRMRSEVAFIQFIVADALDNPDGRLHLSAGDLNLNNLDIEGAELEFIFAGDTLITDYLQFYNGFDKLFTTGRLIRNSSDFVVLDTLYALRNTVELTAEAIAVQHTEGDFVLAETEIMWADGAIQISGNWADRRNFSLAVSTNRRIDVSRLYQFLDIPTSRSGFVDGRISLAAEDNSLIMDISLAAKDGEMGRVPYSRLRADLHLENNTLDINSLDWVTTEGSAKARGQLNYRHDDLRFGNLGEMDSIDLVCRIDNLEFSDLQPVVPWQRQTSGLTSGMLSVTGKASSPAYRTELTVQNPGYDKLRGEELSGSIDFAAGRLYFSDLKLKTKAGQYSGHGTMPLNMAGGLLTISKEDSVNFDFKGTTRRLEFITPYFDNIDSLNGEFEIGLSLSRNFGNLRRDGYLSVENGEVELFFMENEISKVRGSLTIDDNLLVVNKFEGVTHDHLSSNIMQNLRKSFFNRSTPRQGSGKEGKLSVVGTMDMTRFFQPLFDIKMHGQGIYFSTPLKEIEAVGEAEFTVTGRDTILITGQFVPEPEQAIFRRDFVFEEDYVLNEKGTGVIIIYNIYVPFYSGAIVRNSEVDAQIEGELTLTATGGEEFRYAGTVEVISGEFLYNGNSFEIQEGTVLFEPSVFNPQFNLRAVTYIAVGDEPVEITLLMTGSLEDPSLSFSYPPSLSYTDSDLLSLFTIGDVSLSATDPGLAATSGIGNIFLRESEIYARRVSGLDRFQIQTPGFRNVQPGESSLKIALGKRITPRLYVGLQADPSLNLDQYGYQVAYRLGRNMYLEGSLSPGLYRVNYRVKYRY
ncbi:translocation/assembly module TamB domain-containing protein [Candidatus Neomarinimicrobiota bacterium]